MAGHRLAGRAADSVGRNWFSDLYCTHCTAVPFIVHAVIICFMDSTYLKNLGKQEVIVVYYCGVWS